MTKYRIIQKCHSHTNSSIKPTNWSAIPTWHGKSGFNHDVHMDYADCVGEDKFRVMKVEMHPNWRAYLRSSNRL